MMQILQCDFCRRPFNSIGARVCPGCLEEMDVQLTVIRDYIYDNPQKIRLPELSEKTEVPEKVILYMIATGRLVLENIDCGKTCTMCGVDIIKGTICDECAAKVSAEMSKHGEDAGTSASKPADAQSASNYDDIRLMRRTRNK